MVLQYQNTRVRAQRARDASASEHPGVARGRSPPFRKFWPAGAGQLKICNACCTRWRRRLSRPARPAIHQSCRCARCPALSRRPAELALQVQQVALGLRLRQDLRAVGGALREPARHLLADALEDASEEPTAG